MTELDKLIAGATSQVRTSSKELPHVENCMKCRGSGSFIGRNGRALGQCFACKGTGKHTFKTSSEQRAKGRKASAARKLSVADASIEAFKAAHPAEYAWLESSPNFPFAVSMIEGIRKFGSLTENQLAACTRSVEKLEASKKAKIERDAAAPAADTAGVDRLKLAFDTAIANAAAKGRGLKMPRITIGGIVISPAKATSANAGALYVKSAGEYLGKIKDGRLFAARECTPDQEAKILAFVKDPKAAAIAYGIETGVCCVCNAELTNKKSIEAGIGPICATKFGW